MGNRIKWALAATLLLPAALAYSAVTIQDVRLIDYRIDRTKKFVTAKGTSDECHGILVLVTARSDDGKEWTALGDILPRPSVTNEITADAWAGADMMRTVLLNKKLPGISVEGDAKGIRSIMEELRIVASRQKLTTRHPPSPDRQLRGTLCGFDIALVDLVGQVHSVPAFEVLGGKKRDAVRVAAPTFNADAPADALADMVDEADEAFQAMRVKIGLDEKEDVDRIRAVAKSLKAKGDTAAEIWVDVNQAWKTSEKSIAMLERFRDALKDEGFTSRFICEQPTVENDMAALATVTRQTRKWNTQGGVPFQIITCADESVWGMEDARKLVELDAADMVNIKIQKAGGLLASMDMAKYLEQSKTLIYIGGVISTDITAWANLQLCYALPRMDYATGCVPRRNYPTNLATVPVQYEQPPVDGEKTKKQLKAPTRNGLGTFVDLDRLEKYIRHDSANHPTTAPKK
jgi:L-alanine-DL-glutamate epimerase-like enolase superfamily enzyme